MCSLLGSVPNKQGVSAALQFLIYNGFIHLHLHILPVSTNCSACNLDIEVRHIAILSVG